MTELDGDGVAPALQFNTHSPEQIKDSNDVCNIISIEVEEIKIELSEKTPSEDANLLIICEDQPHHLSTDDYNESDISSVKKECGDKTEEVEGDSMADALEDDRSTPQYISLGNHLTEESKREDILHGSSMIEEYPIACKRLKVEIDDPEELEVTKSERNETLKESKPSSISQRLLILEDGNALGAVSIRVDYSIICQMDVQSRVVTVLGIRWCIFVKMESECVSLFLKCLEEGNEFSCHSLMIFYKAHHPTNGQLDIVKTTNHIFTSKEIDWGYKQFFKPSDLSEFGNLLFFSCEFVLQAPQGPRFTNDDTRIPVGLINQGATCYMNAALQILFSTKSLRKAILELDFENEEKGIVKSLQKLFYQMHTSCKALSTDDLTNSFGWENTLDLFIQHDVQEMTKILIDKIDSAFKGTANEQMIDELFNTNTRTLIKCVDVDFESVKDEYCLEIQLPVKSLSESDEPFNLLGAFREVTRSEVMDGDNKYDAQGHGLTRAIKGSKFAKFSKVLHLHLLRFHLDTEKGKSVKIHDRIEFSDLLNLNEFIEDNTDGINYEYALHGVVVHSGKLNGGHYVSYVCKYPGSADQRWFRFDDATVTAVTKDSVICEEHFGLGLDQSFTAYMLTYIRTDALTEVLANVPVSAVSQRMRNEIEMESKIRKLKEIDEEIIDCNTVRIRFVREPDNLEAQLCDHLDYANWRVYPHRFTLRRDDPSIKLFHEAEDLVGSENLRLFLMEKREGNNGEVWRVKRELQNEVVELQTKCVKYLCEEDSDEFVIFVMNSKPICLDRMTKKVGGEKRERVDEKVIFIKWYNGSTRCIHYVTPMEMSGLVSLSHDISQLVCIAAHLPPSSHLLFWKENLFKKLEKLDDLNPIELEMGDIIVFELIHLINKESSLQSVLLDARQVKVSLTQSKNELCYGLMKEEEHAIIDPIILTMNCCYGGLVEELSRRINHPPHMIIIYANGKVVDIDSFNNKIIDSDIDIVDDDPRDQLKVSIEFGRLSVSLTESLQHIGMRMMVRLNGKPPITRTEHLKRESGDIKRLKEKLMETSEIGDINRLRFVWRFRQGVGYFVFREIRADENMMEMIMNTHCALPNSLIICVDEMNEGEKDGMTCDDIILPIVIVHSKDMSQFTNGELTLFIKIENGDDNYSLKNKIEAKYGVDWINWDDMELLSFIGSTSFICKLNPHLGLNSVYEYLAEEPGLSESRATISFLVLYDRSSEKIEEERVNLSQSISIRD